MYTSAIRPMNDNCGINSQPEAVSNLHKAEVPKIIFNFTASRIAGS